MKISRARSAGYGVDEHRLAAGRLHQHLVAQPLEQARLEPLGPRLAARPPPADDDGHGLAIGLDRVAGGERRGTSIAPRTTSVYAATCDSRLPCGDSAYSTEVAHDVAHLPHAVEDGFDGQRDREAPSPAARRGVVRELALRRCGVRVRGRGELSGCGERELVPPGAEDVRLVLERDPRPLLHGLGVRELRRRLFRAERALAKLGEVSVSARQRKPTRRGAGRPKRAAKSPSSPRLPRPPRATRRAEQRRGGRQPAAGVFPTRRFSPTGLARPEQRVAVSSASPPGGARNAPRGARDQV